jgi:translation elongation factor EF-Ts
MPGIVESYIHTGNCIGVLVEISCQSDWSARTSEGSGVRRKPLPNPPGSLSSEEKPE